MYSFNIYWFHSTSLHITQLGWIFLFSPIFYWLNFVDSFVGFGFGLIETRLASANGNYDFDFEWVLRLQSTTAAHNSISAITGVRRSRSAAKLSHLRTGGAERTEWMESMGQRQLKSKKVSKHSRLTETEIYENETKRKSRSDPTEKTRRKIQRQRRKTENRTELSQSVLTATSSTGIGLLASLRCQIELISVSWPAAGDCVRVTERC